MPLYQQEPGRGADLDIKAPVPSGGRPDRCLPGTLDWGLGVGELLAGLRLVPPADIGTLNVTNDTNGFVR